MNKENYNLTNNLSLEDLNNSYLNYIKIILTPNHNDENIEPSDVIPSSQKFVIPLVSGMRWSDKDEQIFNYIPGFDNGKFIEPVEDWEKINYIKPLFTYKKIDLTKNPTNPIENFNTFIDNTNDKIKMDIESNQHFLTMLSNIKF